MNSSVSLQWTRHPCAILFFFSLLLLSVSTSVNQITFSTIVQRSLSPLAVWALLTVNKLCTLWTPAEHLILIALCLGGLKIKWQEDPPPFPRLLLPTPKYPPGCIKRRHVTLHQWNVDSRGVCQTGCHPGLEWRTCGVLPGCCQLWHHWAGDVFSRGGCCAEVDAKKQIKVLSPFGLRVFCKHNCPDFYIDIFLPSSFTWLKDTYNHIWVKATYVWTVASRQAVDHDILMIHTVMLSQPKLHWTSQKAASRLSAPFLWAQAEPSDGFNGYCAVSGETGGG